ncbi:MAG: carboxy terminal-processing peptidase [Planctomycetota bacterium]
MPKSPSRAACTLVLGTVTLVATTIFAQQLAGPQPSDGSIARNVCAMVSKYHINHGSIDDAISSKLLDRYLEVLDPQKLYFLKSDVDQYEKSRLILDDQLRNGDAQFAYDVFNTYRQRVQDRVEFAHQMIDADHDFTVDEEFVTDSEALSYSDSEEALDERWRKRVKLDILNLKLDDTKLDEVKERLHKRYRMQERTINEIESSEVLEMFLSAMTHCFDPHSSYMSPQMLEEFRISMQLSLDGIGAALRSEDGYTFVAQIVKGGAADKDGRLEVGDKIIAVSQEIGEFVDIIEMKLSKVVRLIRGKRGSKVRLQVQKGDSGETIVYDLIRQKIELKESEVKGEIINAVDRTGRKSRIGVINIPSFYRDFNGAERGVENFKSTSRDLQNVLLEFRNDPAGVPDAIIVDLRYNGGGALSEAIEVTGLFIDEGPVVQVKEPGSSVKTYSDDIAGAFNEPLIVVCNRMSASASEIFAGAIKDYRRGIIVGDVSTHGKGTVQNVMPVGTNMFSGLFGKREDNGALKLTINQFYRVNGDSTQNLGVKSDIVLPSLLDHMEVGEASLDNALAFNRIEAADYDKLAYVNNDLLSRLQTRSRQRLADSEDFQKVETDIEKYLDRKNRKSITLNEAKLKAERDADRKADEEEKEEEDAESGDEEAPIFPESAYNDELLNIAIDYVEVLRGAATAQR